MAVVGAQTDILRPAISRKSVIQIKRRLITGERIAETDARVESVQRHAAAPSRIKRLRIEEPVARAYHGFIAYRVRHAHAWGDAAVPLVLRVPDASTRRAPVISGER